MHTFHASLEPLGGATYENNPFAMIPERPVLESTSATQNGDSLTEKATKNNIKHIGGWGVSPTGKSFCFVCACVRAVWL